MTILRIQNFFHFILQFRFDDDGRWQRTSAIGNRRKMIRFEERDMKYGMNFHGCRELQSISLSASSFDNYKGTKTFPIQLLQGLLS